MLGYLRREWGKEEKEGDSFLFLVKLIELLVYLVGYLLAFECRIDAAEVQEELWLES